VFVGARSGLAVLNEYGGGKPRAISLPPVVVVKLEEVCYLGSLLRKEFYYKYFIGAQEVCRNLKLCKMETLKNATLRRYNFTRSTCLLIQISHFFFS
jgi:hypothetical protein